MKNQTPKKIFTFIFLLSGMFSYTVVNAQNCSGNKVWACRYDSCGIQECKCINANQVASWTATVPKCSWKWHPHCCFWRIDQNESGMGIETSLQVSPNPVSTSTAISFSLEQSQNVSLRIFDMNGRLVSTIAAAIFEKGDNELEWNTENVNPGIYFLRLQSAENSETIKLIVTK